MIASHDVGARCQTACTLTRGTARHEHRTLTSSEAQA